LGPGVGLEIGNSFFPSTPDDSFAYLSSRPLDREVIRALIQAGYIDCIHSYGDGLSTRSEVLRILEILDRDSCKLKVWIDHARAPSNFGKDTTLGNGDVPESPIYHADQTLKYGIKFVWKDRATSIVGQDAPLSLACFARILDCEHPKESSVNVAKEIAKVVLARFGNRRFSMHRDNRLLDLATLSDGQRVYEYKRCNNYWRGLSCSHNIAGLAYVLRPTALQDLLAAHGYMVIYTHLGAGPGQPPYIPAETQIALRALAARSRDGQIWVTTTSRMLAYHLSRQCLDWTYQIDLEGCTHITIHRLVEPLAEPFAPQARDLQGLTFYVPDAERTVVALAAGQAITIHSNPPDHTGRQSVTIPLEPLVYTLTDLAR